MMRQKNTYPMKPLAAAVSAAIAAPTGAQAQSAQDSEERADDRLEEIIVTATKREQNAQKIPSSVHALPEAMLKEIGALNTEDYTRFMPSVNWINFTPGQNNLVFRGINTTTGNFISTSSASMYLDEIPVTQTNGAQPEIRMLDVARAEALSGPQGTLFGAAAQSGTLRVITNKPDPTKFEASADLEYRSGQTSDASHSLTGVVNIPIVENQFAVRLAVQTATDGGFVDNVLGHTPDTWNGETAAENAARGGSWGANRLQWGQHRNDDVAEKNYNEVDYTAFRASARWDVNDQWSATAAYHYGETEAHGAPAYNPFVGDLKTVEFVRDYNHTEWDMISLQIEGDLGFAQIVSATSFFENQRSYEIDNTLYYKYYTTRAYCGDRGLWADIQYYWLWENTTTGRAIYSPLYCVMPVANPNGPVDQLPEVIGSGQGPEWQERFAQEIRITRAGENFDWLAGFYYEDANDSWNSIWMRDANVPFKDTMSYAFMQDCANAQPGDPTYQMWQCNPNNYPSGIRSGPGDVAGSLANASAYWTSWDDTDWETIAVFGEVSWHLTDRLNLTVGGRWFEITNEKVYTKILAGDTGSPKDKLTGGFIQPRWDGNDLKQKGKITEFVPKVSIDYAVNDDMMAYALYSEGYRTGGVNRANKRAIWDRTLWGQVWEPDKLANYEVGWKSRFADDRVQLNATFYYMAWDQFQHEVVDPSSGECVDVNATGPCSGLDALPWLSIVGNVGDAHSTGIAAEFDWVASEQLQLGGNVQYLIEAEIDSVTSDERAGIVKGQKLPNVPDWQGALWGTYSWPVNFLGASEVFLRGQVSYRGKTHTALVPRSEGGGNPSFDTEDYAIADLRLGLRSGDDRWQVDLFVRNVGDKRAQVYRGSDSGAWAWGRSGEYERSNNIWTVRPREFGVRLISRWGD